MLSTTERQRGQSPGVFAGGLVVLILFAALAFDAGAMLLERRDQQNAADAAAIAGARYLPTKTDATDAAAIHRTANGFTDGPATDVVVNIPPATGAFAGHRLC